MAIKWPLPGPDSSYNETATARLIAVSVLGLAAVRCDAVSAQCIYI